jgi:hypothetical protein
LNLVLIKLTNSASVRLSFADFSAATGACQCSGLSLLAPHQRKKRRARKGTHTEVIRFITQAGDIDKRVTKLSDVTKDSGFREACPIID